MEKSVLHSLEARLDELIDMYNKLAEENRNLREREVSLLSERTTLRKKTALARNRIEAMIARLKTMEGEPDT